MSDRARRSGRVLALDTATSQGVVAIGEADGTLLSAWTWDAGHHHGDDLLPAVRAVLDATGTDLAELGGLVVGTGPGAFTGLRVGLATAKALARSLDLPIVGVPTAEALLAAAAAASDDRGAGPLARPDAVLLPAGPSDRVLVRAGAARLLRGSEGDAELPAAERLVAVDLPSRAPEAATARGEAALARMPGALLRLGAARLARGETDDLARLVPEYVTLPRGVGASAGEVSWSRDRR